jgi:mono/diheme cytochrome c family protein
VPGRLLALGLLLLAQAPAAAADPLLDGFRRYHATCSHCHGPAGIGSTVAGGLIDPLPDRRRFMQALADGVPGRMPGFADDPNVAPWAEAIRAYLEARAQGRLGRGRPPIG